MSVRRNVVMLLVMAGALGVSDGQAGQGLSHDRPSISRGAPVQAYDFHGRVVSEVGIPVAGAEVSLYGARSASLFSDAEGRFSFTLDKDLNWHTSIVARSDGLVSELLYVYPDEDLTADLRLVKPAKVTGRVRAKDGAPVAGAEVRLVAQKGHSATIAQDKTDHSGRYEIANVAPGSYKLALVHERFTLTEPNDPLAEEGPSTILASGDSAYLDLVVVENAHISGKLLGPGGEPVAGHQFTNGWDRWNHPLTTFETDKRGNFSGYLPPWNGDRSFRIEHATLGFGMLQVPPLGPGERLEDLSVRLSGTMRIAGTVTDPDGVPIAGVRIRNTESDSSGRYDTGWIYLERDSPYLDVEVIPPGQSYQQSPSQVSRLTRDANGNPVMYHPKSIHLEAAHGQERELSITLKPMDARKLRGIVLDELGNPVPNASVLIYQGDALTEQWISALIPRLPPEPEPRRKNWSHIAPEGPAFFLDHKKTDGTGRWESTVFPVPTSFACVWGSNFDPLLTTVAIASEGMTRTGTVRLHFPSEPDLPVDVDIRLDPAGPDETLKVAVQNQDGDPMEDIAWALNCEYGPIVSDGSGELTVPRIASSIYLAIEDRRYFIRHVATRGTIKFAPEPAGDPVRQYAEFIGQVRCHQGLSGTRAPVTADIEWDETWVSLPFFDASQAEVTIVVEEAGP